MAGMEAREARAERRGCSARATWQGKAQRQEALTAVGFA
jgi:hypothetical protein